MPVPGSWNRQVRAIIVQPGGAVANPVTYEPGS